MKKNNKLFKAIKKPGWLFGVFLRRYLSHYLDDRTFIRWEFFFALGKFPNLDEPQTFNEKLQWLKLNDIHPEYQSMVDKFEAKEYVRKIIGEQYVIPTYGLWYSFDEIPFNNLPSKFVLKTTHDSGGIVICTDKSKFDREKAKNKIEKSLTRNFFYEHREYPYKYIKPRIIAEKYMEDESGWQLKDYKIFCFNGNPKFIEVDYDRYLNHKLNVYDLNWNLIDFYMTSPNDKNVIINRPEMLDRMLDFAHKLSEGKTFVRVDFYSINSSIYFGELTFHPGAGLIDFHPKKFDKILGDMLILPK